MSEPVTPNERPSTELDFRRLPITSSLMTLVFINTLVFLGVASTMGMGGVGSLPSQDGFVLRNHGAKTNVTEPVWRFCLIYEYCTLTLTPAIGILFVARQVPFRKIVPWKRWFILAFVCLCAVGLCVRFTESFLRSWRDYQSLRQENPPLQRAPR